ncbi:MAG: YecA family protein [Acidimicrobiales bacterium]
MEHLSDASRPLDHTAASVAPELPCPLPATPWGSWACTARLRWEALDHAVAEDLRQVSVQLLSRDPLERVANRGGAFAVADGQSAKTRTRLYVLADDLAVWGAADATGVAGVLGRLAGSAALVAGRFEDLVASGRFSLRASQGKVPSLLSMQQEAASMGPPIIELGSDDWYPFTTDVLEDAVEAQYGPARLDRSDVVFEPVVAPTESCPACGPGSFAIPDGLGAIQDQMCQAHRQQAAQLLDARLSQARDSNPAGWDGLLEAQRCLGVPHLGVPLARSLARVGAGKGPGGSLKDQAEGVTRSLEHFAGTAEEFAAGLAAWPAESVGWFRDLPQRLLEDGFVDEAGTLAAVLAPLDDRARWSLTATAGVAAVETGRPGHAQELLAELTTAGTPASLHQAARVAEALGERDHAEKLLGESVAMAKRTAEPVTEADAWKALYHILLDEPERQAEATAAAEEMRAARHRARTPEEAGPAPRARPGRNDPCFCGGGRKYKHCHGARGAEAK